MKLTRTKFIRHLLTRKQMENEEKKADKAVGEMRKRRETMADGRRYILYYTFGDEDAISLQQDEVSANV